MTRDELTGAVEALLVDAKPEARVAWRSLLADARLGALLRRLPCGLALEHNAVDTGWFVYDKDARDMGWGNTPDEALTKGIAAESAPASGECRDALVGGNVSTCYKVGEDD